MPGIYWNSFRTLFVFSRACYNTSSLTTGTGRQCNFTGTPFWCNFVAFEIVFAFLRSQRLRFDAGIKGAAPPSGNPNLFRCSVGQYCSLNSAEPKQLLETFHVYSFEFSDYSTLFSSVFSFLLISEGRLSLSYLRQVFIPHDTAAYIN